jgi:hypothetical protein
MKDVVRAMPETKPALDNVAPVSAGPGDRGLDQEPGPMPVDLVAVRPGPARPWAFARTRAALPPRRLVAVAALTPALTAFLAAVAGKTDTAPTAGWTTLVGLVALASATTLATYLPRPGAGLRLDVGCTPCASVAALSVVFAAVVLNSTPHDVPTAIVALGVAAFGVRQRLTDASTCAV